MIHFNKIEKQFDKFEKTPKPNPETLKLFSKMYKEFHDELLAILDIDTSSSLDGFYKDMTSEQSKKKGNNKVVSISKYIKNTTKDPVETNIPSEYQISTFDHDSKTPDDITLSFYKDVKKLSDTLNDPLLTLAGKKESLNSYVRFFYNAYKNSDSAKYSQTFLELDNHSGDNLKTNLEPGIKTYLLLRDIINSASDEKLDTNDKKILLASLEKNKDFMSFVDRYEIDKNFTASMNESDKGITTVSFTQTIKTDNYEK